MTTLFIIIHIFVSLFLIAIVLLQGGKGAELGSTFGGGSSQTLFGGRGAATFMNKFTTIIAIVFMVTSLVLTLFSVRQGSVIKSITAPEKQTLPASPAGGVTPYTGEVKPTAPQGIPSEK